MRSHDGCAIALQKTTKARSPPQPLLQCDRLNHTSPDRPYPRCDRQAKRSFIAPTTPSPVRSPEPCLARSPLPKMRSPSETEFYRPHNRFSGAIA
ncbi:hypothetical protein PMG71_20300 [Roseofilum sp. BLCC_M154]|uniref:Uncharacterized protein n=1 Tax=Roseofilum acuticapitatum BLCC-M154 TaxID=3022444 RepID=A0ABT7AXY9_9CYAN|nr:hypothetical protein [Roseofilum acuticapitatum]MDJ1171774.1 hypothetical protein [Roseofilum acuticapitatum BLCC-M154]